MPVRRTTHRSSKGTKLYAVRDSKGRFKDIQTYKRAHAMDIKRGSKPKPRPSSKKGNKASIKKSCFGRMSFR